ncbi:hypothetical protein AGMMS49531_04140 [Endomicrobiia bacterium]|nr:hypothetical protein AGMMS49531_04140 [Endomicrobiia bacterium]
MKYRQGQCGGKYNIIFNGQYSHMEKGEKLRRLQVHIDRTKKNGRIKHEDNSKSVIVHKGYI